MKLKKIILIYIMLSLYTATAAKEVSLDLKNTIDRAYGHDYELKNSQIDVENSSKEVKKAYKELMPKLNYNGNYTNYEKEDKIDSKNVSEYTENEFVIEQPLFQGGALLAKLDSAKQTRDKKNYTYIDSKINTKLSAIDKYLRVLVSNEELRVYQVSLESLQKQYEKINRKYELDMVSKTEVLPLNTRVLNLKTQVVEAKNNIAVSETDLKNFIGISHNDTVALKGLESKMYDISNINIENDVKYVRNNNRNVKMVDIDSKVKENEKIIARSEFLPKVSGFYSQKSGDERTSNSTDDFNWEAGVAVKMNIFEFGKSMDEYKIKKNEVEKAENLKALTRDNIELQLRKNYLNLVKYKGVVEEQEAAVLSARENYNLESRRFEMDLIDAVSFVQIEQTLVDTELSLLVARYNYFMAFAQYKSLLE
ncbi:MAG: TolC family protein [Fusobacteriaceae bacterium]|nr:TolC family protein [Fusobacteriaceae bacterium]